MTESARSISYAAPSIQRHEALRGMARRCFSETFGHLYPPGPFEEFLDRSYGPQGTMAADLGDPAVRWQVAWQGIEPIGYAKLTPLRAPAPSPRTGALELQQLYLLRDWHGSGVAARLMQWALDTAAGSGAPEIYLTVFDHNVRAKRFYRRYGFAEVGHCTFTMGERVDDDRVWRRVLEPASSTGQAG